MLEVRDTSVFIDDIEFLNNINFQIKSGTLNLLFGENGSGKSSLAYTLMGHPKYLIKKGSITFNNENLLLMPVEKRAKAGLFLACQASTEIPGVTVFSFLKEAYRSICDKEIDNNKFQEILFKIFNLINLDNSFAYRNFNEGFSGGERKRLELVQFLLFKPRLAIFDEIDSGLDFQGIKLLIEIIKKNREENSDSSILIITHNQNLIEYLNPDKIFSIYQGKIYDSLLQKS